MDAKDESASPALVRVEHAPAELAQLRYEEAERLIIRQSFMPGASDTEAAVLIKTAERMNLDVFKRQIHFVKRKAYNEETGAYEEKWAFQTSIDGFRGRAEETHDYEGVDEPAFSFEDTMNPITGAPLGTLQLVARVTVHRRGRRPTTGVARWSEFVQKKRDGNPVRMWMTMPHHMLAKCAEALALRQAFPERLGGLYTDDEMGAGDAGDHEREPANARPDPASAVREKLAKEAERVKAAKAPTPDPIEEARALISRGMISRFEKVTTQAEYRALWAELERSPEWKERSPAVKAVVKAKKDELWPPAAPVAAGATAAGTAAVLATAEEPVKEEVAKVDERDSYWRGKISRMGGDEHAAVWKEMLDTYKGPGGVPQALLDAFVARFPEYASNVGE